MVEEKENDKEPGMIGSAPVFQNHRKIKKFRNGFGVHSANRR